MVQDGTPTKDAHNKEGGSSYRGIAQQVNAAARDSKAAACSAYVSHPNSRSGNENSLPSGEWSGAADTDASNRKTASQPPHLESGDSAK